MRFESRCRVRAVCALLSLAAPCLGLAGAPAPAGAAAVHVENAWIRWLPANLPAAGYATLTNIGDRPEILIGASSPRYGEVSLHQTRNQGGNITMVPVEGITIDPHSRLSFAAAGYHMMLMQPNTAVEPGDHVPITLRFAGGSSLTVEFEVRRPDSSGGQ